MPTYFWPLTQSTPSTGNPQDPSTSGSGGGAPEAVPILNRVGLLRPFREDGINDFAAGSGKALVESTLGQVLGTRCSSSSAVGELPWRPEFGSLLHLLKHATLDAVTEAIARQYVLDAVAAWMPEVSILAVKLTRETEPTTKSGVLKAHVGYAYRSQAGRPLFEGTVSVVLGSGE